MKPVEPPTGRGPSPSTRSLRALLLMLLLPVLFGAPGLAAQSDREQPLNITAAQSDFDAESGVTELTGEVEIRQGSLEIAADRARVYTREGKVSEVHLFGQPVEWQQQVAEQGLMRADAREVEYRVADGIVTLTGGAHVVHPQGELFGEVLRYDLNRQRLSGNGDDEGSRVRIRLEPELLSDSGGAGESDGRAIEGAVGDDALSPEGDAGQPESSDDGTEDGDEDIPNPNAVEAEMADTESGETDSRPESS